VYPFRHTLINMEHLSIPHKKTRRAKLMLAGYTYRSFAAKLHVSEYTVKAAVHGTRNGIKTKRVIRALEALNHAA
jgi:DNA-binding CsgD family transcriptional regulator